MRMMTLGIDATNIRQGGGRTHLIELLRAANPKIHGFNRVVVWGSQSTLSLLDNRSWLIKRSPNAQEGGLIKRTLWQRFELARQAKKERCDLLFVPGGSFSGKFHPFVTMNQNLLPFHIREVLRYGFKLKAVKLLVLRLVQASTFKKSDGVVFLTQYTKNIIEHAAGPLKASIVIPHGLNDRFIMQPRKQEEIDVYSFRRPFRVLYVSIVDVYKHQWNVVEAISIIRKKTGWNVVLDLVGPAYKPAFHKLEEVMRQFDPDHEWVTYHGKINYGELHEIYNNAHLSVWASTCETFGMILLESMGAGLPVASSNHGVMKELLGDSGIYFDPESPNDIARGLERLIGDPVLRAELTKMSLSVAQEYSWDVCASNTFEFLSDVCSADSSF